MKSLEARLHRIETLRGKEAIKIFILRVSQFSSEAEYQKELHSPKYKGAIIILDNWI